MRKDMKSIEKAQARSSLLHNKEEWIKLHHTIFHPGQ